MKKRSAGCRFNKCFKKLIAILYELEFLGAQYSSFRIKFHTENISPGLYKNIKKVSIALKCKRALPVADSKHMPESTHFETHG